MQPATAGTHTVYYYVTNAEETYGVGGSKQVIIDKAQQTAPDSAKLFTRAESYRDSWDGFIEGLTAHKMEYRRADNDGTYTPVYMEKVYVRPGTYLVRNAGDENHYPSPDTELVVEAGPMITVFFNSNGGSAIGDAEGLTCGDKVPLPKTAPTMPNARFLGWYADGKRYNFNTPVTMPFTLTAGWAPKTIDFRLPAGTTDIENAAFEGVPMKSVEIPADCEWVYPDAFKNCAGLKQVLILSAVTKFTPTAFEGCTDVYFFAPADSGAKYLCTEGNGFIFVADVQE